MIKLGLCTVAVWCERHSPCNILYIDLLNPQMSDRLIIQVYINLKIIA